MAGGPKAPLGGFGDVVDTGFSVRGFAALGIPLVPIQLRGEIAYSRLPRVDTGNASVTSGTVNGVFRLLPTSVVSPYLIGGAGMYRTSFDGNTDARTDLGMNAGVGIQANLMVVRLFAESRYEHVLGDGARPQMMPILVGVSF